VSPSGAGPADRDAAALALALVGLGRMGSTHLRALREARRVRPVAVVDPDPRALGRARDDGLAAHASVAELLAAGRVDAALVAAPTPLHLRLTAPLLEAGIPVLCEKPLGPSAGVARAAGAVAERTGTPLAVAYWRRFVPSLAALRARIIAGELGEISLIGCWQWDAEPPPAAFRADSGGIAVDMGVHEFDQIRWLTGETISEPVTVAAHTPSAPPVDGDPDSAAILGRLSGGGAAFVSLGRRFPGADACWVEVWGTRGHAREPFLVGENADHVFRNALAAQADAFAAMIRTEADTSCVGSPATWRDAVAALELAAQVHAGGRGPGC
jgi:myo-inositol 2-dehydrogenase/D-chiro-inositol 1-dehydrogenase